MRVTCADRLAMRARPDGAPIMEQSWDNLLFLHWPVDAALLRPLIPSELKLDTFEDQAWIGITPFTVNKLRLGPLPPVPGLDSFYELNVRTYVHLSGTPGVWFFSLDASKILPAAAARLTYALPYHKATMSADQNSDSFAFSSERTFSPAQFHVKWKVGLPLRDPDPESLAFFLVERYCLFAERSGSIEMTRVYHTPWVLHEAHVSELTSTMISAHGLPEPIAAPLAHFSKHLPVQIWPMKVLAEEVLPFAEALPKTINHGHL